MKYWYIPLPFYIKTPLPGWKEGISGSTAGGHNVGINTYISDMNKEASIKVLEYINSWDVHKDNIALNNILAGIPSLYDDEEVCANVDCSFFKSIQLTLRKKEANYNDYSEKYRKNLMRFLYEDEDVSAEETLKKINDITKIYYISLLNTDETSVGLLFFIICTVLTILMLSSLIFLYNKKKMKYFEFLPNDFWIIIIVGLVIVVNVCFFGYGKSYPIKCHFLYISLCFGFNFIFIPILYKLICNFPEYNNFSEKIKRHRHIFFFGFLMFDILLALVIFISPYSVETKYIDDGKNFEICLMKNTLGNIIITIARMYKFIIILAVPFLIFLEWSIHETHYDIRFLVCAIYLDVTSFIFFMVITFLNMTNYILMFTLYNILYIFIGISNYLFLYGYRLIFDLIIKEDNEEAFIKNLKDNFKSDNSNLSASTTKSVSTTNTGKSKSSKFSNKILNYHYQESINTNNLTSVNVVSSINASTSKVNIQNP